MGLHTATASSPVDGQHAALRRLFEKVTTNKPASWTAENSISEWAGIKLDANGNVLEIVAQFTSMQGQLNNDIMLKLGTLLPNLRKIDLHGHRLSGPCSLDALGPQLVWIGLWCDRKKDDDEPMGLTGPVDISKLPLAIEHINIENNVFCGAIDWDALSARKGLEVVGLGGNLFEGPVELEHVPRSVTNFSIQDGSFSGTANLSDLPSNLSTLSVTGNARLTLAVSDVAKFPRGLDESSYKSFQRIPEIELKTGGDVVTGEEFFKRAGIAPAGQQQIAPPPVSHNVAPAAAATNNNSIEPHPSPVSHQKPPKKAEEGCCLIQ